jgi:hypothetical protein
VARQRHEGRVQRQEEGVGFLPPFADVLDRLDVALVDIQRVGGMIRAVVLGIAARQSRFEIVVIVIGRYRATRVVGFVDKRLEDYTRTGNPAKLS